MKNIIIISATSGNNLNLARKIGELIELKYQIISLEDYHLPLYTGNIELENRTLINDLCQKVINADGFIFCGPEYNGGSAPILTNAITWISVTTDYWKDAFKKKKSVENCSSLISFSKLIRHNDKALIPLAEEAIPLL